MEHLPILNSAPISSRTRSVASRGRPGAFWLRIALLILAIWGLHATSQRNLERARLAEIEPPSLASVQRVMPVAARVEAVASRDGASYRVYDANDKLRGMVITTAPEADSIVGYSGSHNVLLLLDEQQQVLATALIRSNDTTEHVAQVVGDDEFWRQFNGMSMGEASDRQIDGVSGATLTSLSIAEGIQLRLSGRKLSLRFPNAIRLEEIQALWPQVASIGEPSSDGAPSDGAPSDGAPSDGAIAGLQALQDTDGEQLGWAARTGEVVDAEEGYQGPTELLLLFDLSGVLTQVRIRSSFDNEPYVGYVRQEYSFWYKFKGRNFSQLAALDLDKEEIEGVSGATMTSLAVARTIRESMKQLQDKREKITPRRLWNWSLAELATASIALAGIAWSRSRWRSKTWLRLTWQALCFVVIGCWAGNLISLALIAGWTHGGIPVRLAPGLSLLLLVAVVWPVLSKQNVYCDHICPHGAAQQWLSRLNGQLNGRLKGRSRLVSKLKPSRWDDWVAGLIKLLSITPWLALVVSAVWLLSKWRVPLAWLEPFDAYAWRIGLSVSSVVWLASLALSALKPMAYCRVLCPTGKAIDYVRRSPRVKLGWRDAAVLVVAVVAWSQAIG